GGGGGRWGAGAAAPAGSDAAENSVLASISRPRIFEGISRSKRSQARCTVNRPRCDCTSLPGPSTQGRASRNVAAHDSWSSRDSAQTRKTKADLLICFSMDESRDEIAVAELSTDATHTSL